MPIVVPNPSVNLTNLTAQQQLQAVINAQRALLMLMAKEYGVDPQQILNAGVAWTQLQ